jgi:glc operon protein GlcG
MAITLPTKPVLTTDLARQILETSLNAAKDKNLRMSIAVVDDGGSLLAFVRMSEQIAAASAEVAIAKAKSAAMFKRATLSWEQAAKDRTVVLKIPHVVPLGGGVPLTVDGVTIGAIGVSGSSSVVDDEIANAGAAVLAA